jgi:hypothetical protein
VLGSVDVSICFFLILVNIFLISHSRPHSRFLLQNERFAFNELVNSSVLPSFTSDMVLRHPEQHAKAVNRVSVPILDKEAHVSYYCCYLKKSRNRLQAFMKGLQQ